MEERICLKCGKLRKKFLISNPNICIYCGRPKSNKIFKICNRCGKLRQNFSKVKKDICVRCYVQLQYLKKYGVLNNSSLKSNKEKIHQTFLNKTKKEKEQIIKKREQTLIQKYGVTNPTYLSNHNLKTQQTCLKKYGVKNPSQNKEIRDKQKQTSLKKYGKTVFANTLKGQQSRRSRYFYDNQSFDSKPEICFYLYCKDFNLNIKRCSKAFEYKYNSKIYSYFPDFEIDGKFYEIKGDQFLTEDGKWQNPFNHTLDELFEEKRQCALKNNVTILYEKDYQKYIDYIKEKYGRNYLNQFKN